MCSFPLKGKYEDKGVSLSKENDMAKNITGQALGGKQKVLENAETVLDVFKALELNGNYTASVNGDAASMEDELEDYSFVSFAQATKGGLI